MSQFSAAVADTAGAGGLVEEESGGRISGAIRLCGGDRLGVLHWSG